MDQEYAGSFRLYKLPLDPVEGDPQNFMLHDSPRFVPCGAIPTSMVYRASSIWILATHGYIKVPSAVEMGSAPLCQLCSKQLYCSTDRDVPWLKSDPDVTDLPTIRASEHPRWSDDFTVGTNVFLLDAPGLLAAPFDDEE